MRKHNNAQLKYSILPEYTEFQRSLQQVKTKFAQQFYNFTNLNNATIYM